MNTIPRFLPALALSVVALLLGLKCGGDGKSPSSSGAACAGVGKGNTLAIRLEAAPKQLHPLLSVNAYANRISERVFQSLSETDPQTLKPQPVLIMAIPAVYTAAADPYKGSPAYDFVLHPDATWDNGTPVTAADVVFTFKAIANPLVSTPYRGYFDLVQAVETNPADPRKFTVYLKKYYMLALESVCGTPIYPAYHYDPNGYLAQVQLTDLLDPKKSAALAQAADGPLKKFADEFQSPKYATDPASMVGSGPYTVTQFDGDQGATLVRKTNWWGDKAVATNPILRAAPEKLVYRVVKEDLAVENMLKTGDLDVAATLAAPNFLALQKDASVAGCYDFSTRTGAQYSSWGFNLQNPRLRDPALRRALSHLVDYNYIINTVYQGLALRGTGPISPKAAYFAKDLPMPDYDPQKATDLLKAAGWTDTNGDGSVDKVLNGKREELVIKVLAAASPVTQQIVAGLTDAVAKGGVKIQSESLEMSVITERLKKGDYESVVWARAQALGLTDLYQVFHSRNLAPAGDNRYRLANPALDKLIDEIRSTPDEAARNALYIKAQQLFVELMPEITLCVPQVRVIVSKRFDHALTDNRPGYYVPFFALKK